MDEGQVLRVHGPYEDAIIAGFELAKEVIAGQDPATKAELWKRHLELTEPLHKLAVAAAQDIGKLFEGRKK